jgi:hypothetical protein
MVIRSRKIFVSVSFPTVLFPMCCFLHGRPSIYSRPENFRRRQIAWITRSFKPVNATGIPNEKGDKPFEQKQLCFNQSDRH